MGHFNIHDSANALLIHVMTLGLPQNIQPRFYTSVLPMDNVHATVAYKFILIGFTIIELGPENTVCLPPPTLSYICYYLLPTVGLKVTSAN